MVLRRRRSMSRNSQGSDKRTDITRLFRNPAQLEQIADLLREREAVSVLVYGAADGAEVVSLLATLAAPGDRQVSIRGRDLDESLIEAARSWCYLPQHAPDGLPDAASRVLEPRPVEGWQVRESYRQCLTYEVGNVLDAASDASASYDLVCCQNTLTLFAPNDIERAISGLVAHVCPGGFIALGGGPLDIISKIALESGLQPVLEDAERIHESWTVQRQFWNNNHKPRWALEPFGFHGEEPVRYATLFRKPLD